MKREGQTTKMSPRPQAEEEPSTPTWAEHRGNGHMPAFLYGGPPEATIIPKKLPLLISTCAIFFWNSLQNQFMKHGRKPVSSVKKKPQT